MTGIPSDIGASAAQAGYQSQDVAKVRDSHSTGKADAASRQVKAADEAAGMVDTTDKDTQVFADAEGSGSMGREPESEESQGELSEGADSNSITEDDQGQLHLDLEA